MKKLHLFLLFVPLFSCSSDDDSSNGDFFENHQNKIWTFTYTEPGFNIGAVAYIGFLNRKYNYAGFEDDGSYFCETLFLGTKNNYYDQELDNVFGEGAEVNVTTEIIVNKANELQIETITSSLAFLSGPYNIHDGSKVYPTTFKFIVNGDNITYTFIEGNGGYTDIYDGEIYNGNLDINFNNCTEYIGIY